MKSNDVEPETNPPDLFDCRDVAPPARGNDRHSSVLLVTGDQTLQVFRSFLLVGENTIIQNRLTYLSHAARFPCRNIL
jgi:hypothetical protein